MRAAYGKVAESCTSLTECMVKTWRSKLCSIPPTSEAFTENVHISHIHVVTWKAALLESPPEMDWERDYLGILVPRIVPSGTLSEQPDILQLIHCNGKKKKKNFI